MRLSPLTRFATVIAVCTLTAGAVRAQSPILSGVAGSGSNDYFFVMDFNDFAAPQSYAFEYLSNATSLTFEQILNGLAPVPTYSATIASGSEFGDSLNGLAYAGKTKFNDFLGDNSGQPNGYWSQWASSNGVNWTEDSVGITYQTITAGQWVGASWTGDYTVDTDSAPRVPMGAAGAPEPESMALFGAAGLPVALGGLAGMARRRRPKAR